MLGALLDPLAFSSLWVALAAAALCVASALGMGASPPVPAVGIALAGTLVVYNVDRLRDLERDRVTTPLRSAFVERHFAALTALVAAAAAASFGFALALGPRALFVLAPVLVVGLLHRRLKRFAYAKASYIALAWLAVVVGLPAVLDPSAAQVAWVAAIVGCGVLANAIASNVRDAEAAVERLGAGPVLWIARGLAAFGIALGALAPPPARALVAVPAATLATLVWFRPDERYGLVWVDGALLVGAGIAIAWLGG